MHAIRPIANNGLTAATNATVGNTAAGIKILGSTIIVTIGVANVQPAYIMFGVENQASSLTSSTGLRLPAGFCGRFDVPGNATHLYHLRVGASDSDISVLGCEGGI